MVINLVMEAKFKPEEGQLDYTNIRYAPVINCVLRYKDRILIVQRSAEMRLYPNLWNGISGFLDDQRSVEEKVKDELREELGIEANDIILIQCGPIHALGAEEYDKTWIVFPVLVEVKTDKIKLNWEAQDYQWLRIEEIKNLNLFLVFDKVLAALI